MIVIRITVAMMTHCHRLYSTGDTQFRVMYGVMGV